MKKILITISVVLVLLAASVLGFVLYEHNKESKKNNEIISQSELFDVTGNEIAIIYDFSLQSAKGICRDGRAYLPLSWVRDYINDKFSRIYTYNNNDNLNNFRVDFTFSENDFFTPNVLSKTYEYDKSGNLVTSSYTAAPSYCSGTGNNFGFDISSIDGSGSDILAQLVAYADAADLAKQYDYNAQSVHNQV